MFDIAHTPVSVTIARMAELIDAVAASNHASLGPISSDITPFHSRAVPSISVHDYLARIAKFVCLENDSLLAVLVYLDRVARNHLHRPALALSPYNIHRLLITAIVVAHKFNSDIFFNNARYSKVGGIPLVEMNQLELELLFLIKFDLKIDHDQLQQVGKWLVACPHADLCDSPKTGGQSACVLEAYYRGLETAAKQAELCHVHYPTPLMDPTPIRSAASVSFLDLNGSAPAAAAAAAASTTGLQQPIPTTIHRPPHHSHQYHHHHHHYHNHLHQQQAQPMHQHLQNPQHHHQSKHHHPDHQYKNAYSCAPQITTPSSVDTSSSLGFNGSLSFVAPQCPSVASTLCHGFAGSELDHGSWRSTAALSPASPDNQMLNGSLVGTSSDSLKRRKFPGIGFPIGSANAPSAIGTSEQDTAASGVFIIDED